MSALTLQFPPALKLTDEKFEQLIAVNQELRLELTAQGELVIMNYDCRTSPFKVSKNFAQ